MLETSQRLLFNNGISVVTEEQAVRELLKNGSLPSYMKLRSSSATKQYELRYDEKITYDGGDVEVEPSYDYTEEERERLIARLFENKRDDTPDKAHENRLGVELEFFIDSGSMDLLCSVTNLIEEFRENGVVWGTGRGSSCASYVLYLLEVHDVNPIAYDIDFREFSKGD